MAQTFYPKKKLINYVAASLPHPPNTQYKISVGSEYWGEDFARVLKIQMVYDGKISGRKSPSFTTKEDCEKVIQALVQLMETLEEDQ